MYICTQNVVEVCEYTHTHTQNVAGLFLVQNLWFDLEHHSLLLTHQILEFFKDWF